MAVLKLNAFADEISGALGQNMVFRRRNGKTIVASRPAPTANPSEGQLVHRNRFRQAVTYAKAVMADAAARAVYDAAAETKDTPVFALIVADFLKAPTLNEPELGAYHGQIGEPIKLVTHDDIGVVSVRVQIIHEKTNNIIEEGFAVETPVGTGRWTYTATATAPDDVSCSSEHMPLTIQAAKQ